MKKVFFLTLLFVSSASFKTAKEMLPSYIAGTLSSVFFSSLLEGKVSNSAISSCAGIVSVDLISRMNGSANVSYLTTLFASMFGAAICHKIAKKKESSFKESSFEEGFFRGSLHHLLFKVPLLFESVAKDLCGQNK